MNHSAFKKKQIKMWQNIISIPHVYSNYNGDEFASASKWKNPSKMKGFFLALCGTLCAIVIYLIVVINMLNAMRITIIHYGTVFGHIYVR